MQQKLLQALWLEVSQRQKTLAAPGQSRLVLMDLLMQDASSVNLLAVQLHYGLNCCCLLLAFH